MSLINKMLQDLDRRQALGTPPTPPWCAPPTAKPASREWFWRVLVVLLDRRARLDGLGRDPAPAAQAARHRARFPGAARGARRARRSSRAAAPAAAPAPARRSAGRDQPVARAAHRSLPHCPGRTIAAERTAAAGDRAADAAGRASARARARARPSPEAAGHRPSREPKAAPAAKPAAKASVDKRDRTRAAADNAEAHFRRAALLLNHGRVSEAEEQLLAALQADPRTPRRGRPMSSLLLEQQRVDGRAPRAAGGASPSIPSSRRSRSRWRASMPRARLRRGARRHRPRRRRSAAQRRFPGVPRRDAAASRPPRRSGGGLPERGARRHARRPPPGSATPSRSRRWAGAAKRPRPTGARSTVGPIAAEAREYAESRARALE